MKPLMKKRKKRRLPAGWMGKGSLAWLAKQASTTDRVIEVGCWLGRSTLVLAKYCAGTVFAVDHWKGTPADMKQHQLYAGVLKERSPYAEFRANLKRYIGSKRVVPVRMGSVEAAAKLLDLYGPVFGFVFIDADHSYEGCRGDILAYRPLVKPGGVLAGHDYHWPGVKQAVDELIGPNVTLGPSSIWSTHV
jgi:predicted O-methyltransferase YrrM